MNKSYKFKKDDAVVSDGMAGVVKGIVSVGGVTTHLRVELIGSGAVRYFRPANTKLMEFNPNMPSNKYLESVLKGKQNKSNTPVKKVKTRELSIDELLDKYNDSKELFKQFGDNKYKEDMSQLILKLKMAAEGIPVLESIEE